MKNILVVLVAICLPVFNHAHPNTGATSARKLYHNVSGYTVFNNQQQSREQLTIRWLAKTLTRMGETKTAKRLMDDYFVNKRVTFGIVNDGNAETGKGRNGVNEMTLSETLLLNTADMDRLLKLRPYGDKSSLISDALTVLHEYVHMDQDNPQNEPAWEDPAWHISDNILNNWTKRIEAEYNAARQMPASKEKTAQLGELTDIINRLYSEMGVTKEAINKNIANKSVSPNQKWLLDDTEQRLQAMKNAIKKYDAIGKLGPQQPPQKKDPGYWELVNVQAFDKLAATDVNYGLTAADGSIQARWSQNNDVFKVTATYTPAPKQIRLNDKIPVQMSVTLTNQGDQYSANGDFAIFFDRPEIEPGSVIAPISLKGDNGEKSYIQFTHKAGVPPTPSSSLLVYIDGKALPAGSKGARIALLAAVYNGRNAGYRYVYEWRDNW